MSKVTVNFNYSMNEILLKKVFVFKHLDVIHQRNFEFNQHVNLVTFTAFCMLRLFNRFINEFKNVNLILCMKH